jgi:hypothetical protein
MRFSRLAFLGRISLLFLFAGHLLMRQGFAHISLTDILRFAGRYDPLTPRPTWIPAAFDSAYITELFLIALLPIAVYLLLNQSEHQYESAPGREKDVRSSRFTFYFSCAFLLWGIIQALLAIFLPPRQLPDLPPPVTPHSVPDWYLILRQSALSGYVLFFIYTVIFFRARERYILQAFICGVAFAILCAVLDIFQMLGSTKLEETLFGQETLPLAILAAIFVIVTFDNFLFRGIAVAILALVGWRQSLRFQSGIVVSLAGAMFLYFLLGASVVWRGQLRTFHRGIACIAIIAIVMLVVYFRASMSQKMAEKLQALKPGTYKTLLENYDLGRPPLNPKERMTSNREPFVPVADPEVYRVEAVYDTLTSIAVKDNVWRLLVWRRMLREWYDRNPIIGAGVGQPWFYEALYHSKFHYGEDREGLDPHNSYLNILHRYGLVGFVIFACLLAGVFVTVWRALRVRTHIGGDPLLEVLALYFFYTAVFAFFNNALEGPSYAMPFWFSMGLMYARARQMLVKDLPPDPILKG